MASPTAGWASQQVLEASVPFDAVLMDMQMLGYRWSRGDPENPRRRALRRAADPRHDRQRLAGRPRSRLAAGMNDHVAKPIDKERLVLCLLGHLGRRLGVPATAADAGELVEARGDIVGRFGGSLELIVRVAALRSGYAGPLRPARTPARRGRCPGSAATLHTIKGSASTVGASACRPCQRAGAGPAPR